RGGARAGRPAGGPPGDRRTGHGGQGSAVDGYGGRARGPCTRPPRDVRRRRRGRRSGPVDGASRGSRAGQGLAGGAPGAGGRCAARGARPAGQGGSPVTPILVAAATGLLAALVGTPIAIRLFRAWGWGQRIREDGPQGHMAKMGTPTMGGVVVIAGMAIAYAVARIRTPFTVAGMAALGVAVGLGAVGFL